jgi:anti-sigma factor RsiW
MPEKLTHPTQEKLSAFSLGQLPSEEAAVIEAHVTECQPCCETLLNVSDEDTFVELLKEADRAPDEATVDLNINALSRSREATAEIPPSLLDHARYRVVGLVGRGGMGDVYQAEHRMMERAVALKVIKRDLIYHRFLQIATWAS